MHWLRLIRWQNLLIIALTQLLAWWCVVLPQNPELLSATNALLLMLSTVLIAAAGYIINDYFDVRIDQLNHPDTVLLGKVIVRKNAIKAHIAANAAAVVIAGYLAIQGRHYEWLLLQLFCIAMLWFYSTTYKRQYMSGNVTVSVLTALTIISLFVYEPALQRLAQLPLTHMSRHNIRSSLPVWILLVYAGFAFLLTWIREIIKDMEDMEGDAAEGCVTMPIKRGLSYAAGFATVLAVCAILPLVAGAAVLYRYGYLLMAGYAIALLALPLAAWVWYLWQGAATTLHYHKCSRLLKIIMVLGVCSLLIYKLQ
jgi:4-hydroxybenzoate polyprenyltransferase